MTFQQALLVNIGDTVVHKKTGEHRVVTGKNLTTSFSFAKHKRLRLVFFRCGPLSVVHTDVRLP